MDVKSMTLYVNPLMLLKENKCEKIYYNINNSNKKKKKINKNLKQNN